MVGVSLPFRVLAAVAGLGLVATLTMCARPATADTVAPPPANAPFDYQLGGPYDPRPEIEVVTRDRTAEPAPGLYNICYVNAFQTQPDEAEVADWRQRGLLLTRADGTEIEDGDWDEYLLDIRTEDKRAAIAATVNGWIDGCADAGYQAIEPDNLDSYLRSEDLITTEQTMAYLRLLIDHAHERGLAIAQKNAIGSPEDGGLGTAGRDAGLDFAVAEECGEWTECDDYTELYDDRVIVIEYTEEGFTAACDTVGDRVSVVLRDLDVTPGGTYQAC